MLYLTDTQKMKLAHLVEDKDVIEGLKRLFWESFTKRHAESSLELAAERVAISLLADGFKDLEALKVDNVEDKVSPTPGF